VNGPTFFAIAVLTFCGGLLFLLAFSFHLLPLCTYIIQFKLYSDGY